MRQSKSFSGFPEGEMRMTELPHLFFSELLPAIDHLGELKVTLYAFWALQRREQRFAYLRRDDFAGDSLFMAGMSMAGLSPEQALDESLERAVSRGTLLKAVAPERDGEAFYFLNSPRGQAALKALQTGQWTPGEEAQRPVELALERPNIFVLYEQNIGPLTPMMADELLEAEKEYPAAWIEEAIRIAVENNVRKWRYVQAILENWRTQGRDEREDRGDTEKARRRYLEGEFADFLKGQD
jgi:DNA replication protein